MQMKLDEAAFHSTKHSLVHRTEILILSPTSTASDSWSPYICDRDDRLLSHLEDRPQPVVVTLPVRFSPVLIAQLSGRSEMSFEWGIAVSIDGTW